MPCSNTGQTVRYAKSESSLQQVTGVDCGDHYIEQAACKARVAAYVTTQLPRNYGFPVVRLLLLIHSTFVNQKIVSQSQTIPK